MAAVRTGITKCSLSVSWMQPNFGGSPISKYNVEVLGSGLKEHFPIKNCGRTASELSCEIPLAKLQDAPFNLKENSLIIVRA